MTIDEIKKRINEIRERSGDDESAHGLEDKLYYDILVSIADGSTDDAQGIAREAIKTQAIRFSRWCA